MSEQENIVETVAEPQPSKGKLFWSKVGAGLKEWGRKQIVGLKKAPQKIFFLFALITTALWLIWLFAFSHTIALTSRVEWTGMAVFGTTLLSILTLALYFSAFPKRGKPKLVFIILLFVFMILQILFDVVYYTQEHSYIYRLPSPASYIRTNPFIGQAFTYAIVHIVLNGVCIVLLATLPLYSKLIMKINTRKEVETTEIKEEIDTSDAD